MSSTAATSVSGSSGRASATSPTLLARVRAHDPEAWDRLVALYAPFVFDGCRKARLSFDDASDVFQDVFQAAFARIESFQKARRGDTFRGWLRVITRNKVIDHLRRQERELRGEGGTQVQARWAELASPAETGSAGRAPDPAELRLCQAALDAIRGHFQPRTWEAFEGTVLDGRAPADVGDDLGMTAGAVRVAKSRVLQRLRAELGDLA